MYNYTIRHMLAQPNTTYRVPLPAQQATQVLRMTLHIHTNVYIRKYKRTHTYIHIRLHAQFRYQWHRFKYTHSMQGLWHVAVYNPGGIWEVGFTVGVTKTVHCPANCSGHGQCSQDGQCECEVCRAVGNVWNCWRRFFYFPHVHPLSIKTYVYFFSTLICITLHV